MAIDEMPGVELGMMLFPTHKNVPDNSTEEMGSTKQVASFQKIGIAY